MKNIFSIILISIFTIVLIPFNPYNKVFTSGHKVNIKKQKPPAQDIKIKTHNVQ